MSVVVQCGFVLVLDPPTYPKRRGVGTSVSVVRVERLVVVNELVSLYSLGNPSTPSVFTPVLDICIIMSSSPGDGLPSDDMIESLFEVFAETSIDDTGKLVEPLSILKEVLKNSWRFEHEDYQRAKQALALHHWDLATLTNAYLYAQTKGLLEAPNGFIKDLVTIAFDRISEELSDSKDLSSDIAAVIDSLPLRLLRGVLGAGRITYPVLRAILSQNKSRYGPVALLQDVDEAILHGTVHMEKHEKNLVKLDELITILGGPPKGMFSNFSGENHPPEVSNSSTLDANVP